MTLDANLHPEDQSNDNSQEADTVSDAMNYIARSFIVNAAIQ